LVLDDADYPHIAYNDTDGPTLKYVYQDVTGWHYEVVDPDQYGVAGVSMKLDNSGYPHLSYVTLSDYEVRYAYKDSSGWSSESVDNTNVYPTSLALDSLDRPHISYGSSPLKYAFQNGQEWEIGTIDDHGSISYLAIDMNDYPHVAYTSSYNSSGLAYAYLNENGWQITIIDEEGSKNSIVKGNIIKNNGCYGLYLVNTSVKICDNIFINNGICIFSKKFVEIISSRPEGHKKSNI